MTACDVFLPEMPRDGKPYELWSSSVVHLNSRSAEIEILIELRNVENGTHTSRWLPFSRLSLLPLGSRWLNGKPQPTHVELQWISPDLTQPIECLPICHSRGAVGVFLGEDFPLTLKEPPGRVWRFSDTAGTENFVTVHEILRSHYCFDYRILPSLFGGLSVHGKLTNPARQAWFPDPSPWVDYPGGHARLRVGRDLDDRSAFRIARVVLVPEGQENLRRFYQGFKPLLMSTSKSHAPPPWIQLPAVGLPYSCTGVRWQVSCVSLPAKPDGTPRRLIRHIERHDVQEPWTQIDIFDGFRRRTKPSEPTSPGSAATGSVVVLEPYPREPVEGTSKPTDGRLQPLQVNQIATIDQQAELYAAKAASITSPGGNGSGGGRRGKIVVTQGSTESAGNGAGRPGLVPNHSPSGGLPFKTAGEDLRPILELMAKNIYEACSETSFRFLPGREDAYTFKLPARGTKQPDSGQPERQFLIFEIQFQSRFAYVIDPARRSADEVFPIAALARHDARRLTWPQIKSVARGFEDATRRPGSWVNHAEIRKFARATPVVHSPRTRWKACVESLEQRLREAVLHTLTRTAP
jgi:hypothetical protein